MNIREGVDGIHALVMTCFDEMGRGVCGFCSCLAKKVFFLYAIPIFISFVLQPCIIIIIILQHLRAHWGKEFRPRSLSALATFLFSFFSFCILSFCGWMEEGVEGVKKGEMGGYAII